MKITRGDFNSHMDFLAAHGFVTEEELESQLNFEREIREHPERFETLTLEEMLKPMREFTICESCEQNIDAEKERDILKARVEALEAEAKLFRERLGPAGMGVRGD